MNRKRAHRTEPTIPVPCSIEIFSSIVISLTTIAALSSGREADVHPGMGFIAGLSCRDCREKNIAMAIDKREKRKDSTAARVRGAYLTSVINKIDIVAARRTSRHWTNPRTPNIDRTDLPRQSQQPHFKLLRCEDRAGPDQSTVGDFAGNAKKMVDYCAPRSIRGRGPDSFS